MQEFDLEIKDKKGSENLVADYLSYLEYVSQENQISIKEEFLDEFLVLVKLSPWYANLVNYVVSGIIPRKFLHDVKHYFWEELFFY